MEIAAGCVVIYVIQTQTVNVGVARRFSKDSVWRFLGAILWLGFYVSLFKRIIRKWCGAVEDFQYSSAEDVFRLPIYLLNILCGITLTVNYVIPAMGSWR